MARGTPTPPLGLICTVKGDAELARSFDAYSSKVRERIRTTLTQLAEEILAGERARFSAKGGTGATIGSFTAQIAEGPGGFKARVGWWRMGKAGGSGYKGIFKETGVNKRFWVRNIDRGTTRTALGTQKWTIRRGSKPGWYREVHIPAQPFVAPTWEAMRGRVQSAMESALDQAKVEVGLAA